MTSVITTDKSLFRIPQQGKFDERRRIVEERVSFMGSLESLLVSVAPFSGFAEMIL